MTRTLEDANHAITATRRMPFGLARNEVAAELVREIDAEGPETALAYALFALVESYAFSQEVEKAYLPFTRSVRLWDERPELFDADDTHSLFWSFKWMVGDLMSYPAIPAAQIQATLADMERRYLLAGNGLSAVNHLLFEWHHLLGDDEAGPSYERWVTTERDAFSQCPACEPGDRTTYLFAQGRVEEGIRLLEEAQRSGATCRTEPADMLSQLQLAYLEVGDAEGAARAHRHGLATLDSSGEMPSARGRHIQFLARTGNTTAALRFLERYQRLLTGAETPRGRWAFLTTAGVGVAALRATVPDTPLALDAVEAATVGELDDWMRAQALFLAAQFDERGGTSAMTERTLHAWSGTHVRVPVDLTVLALDPADHISGRRPGDDDASERSGPAVSDVRPFIARAGIGPDSLVHQAELLTGTDPVSAARLYAHASSAFAEAGEHEAAGFALAEAAMLSDQLGDSDGAAATIDAAVALLQTAGTGLEYVGPVIRVAARLSGAIGAWGPATDLLDWALTEAEGASPTAALALERAHLLDTRARVHASRGEGAAALADACTAAEAFTAHHRTADAAHASWLAGTIELGAGRPDAAVTHLESAAQGFTLVRAREQQAEVLGQLIQALTALGRADDAAVLVRQLAG
ncbi:hypothetical protein [Sanguibacter suarezii]|uniref:hypothetical protein n=1 Tax=Sanguibacter suarezii TaxID=60921 RepID=UPI0008377D45|nr:hypothetical protein [Sanguibacter suarezii]